MHISNFRTSRKLVMLVGDIVLISIAYILAAALVLNRSISAETLFLHKDLLPMVMCVTGLMMKLVRTGKLLPDLYISMITAMVLGRVVSGLAKSLIFAPGTAPFAWVTTSLVAGIPGICIQLILMPMVIFALTRARLIPTRYAK